MVQSILTQVPDLERIQLFLINVPNGVGEAHLFTHNSLRFALGRELGRLPDLTVLTRINVSSKPSHKSRVSVGGDHAVTRIQPGPQDYFVFDTPELLPRGGRFLSAGTQFRKGPFLIEVSAVSPSGQVSEVMVHWQTLTAKQRLFPVYP